MLLVVLCFVFTAQLVVVFFFDSNSPFLVFYYK